jgi:hypothetical protein
VTIRRHAADGDLGDDVPYALEEIAAGFGHGETGDVDTTGK